MTLDMTSLHREVIADAGRRSGVDSGRIHVVQSQAVTWRDGSLGCPEPGRMYTQALIRGYLIRVQADAALLEYHVGSRGQWLHCPAERAIAPLPDTST
jgi:hypothetical protein